MGEFVWVTKELMLYSVPIILLIGLLALSNLLSYKRERKFIIVILLFEIATLPVALYFHSEIATIIAILIGFSNALYVEERIAENINCEEKHIFLSSIVLGAILAVVALATKHFDLGAITYALMVVGVASAMALSKCYSFLSEITLALTLIPVVTFYNYSALIYPTLMLISIIISLNGLEINIKNSLSENVELKGDEFSNYFLTAFVIVVLLAFAGLNVISFDRLLVTFQKRTYDMLNNFSSMVYHYYKDLGEDFLRKASKGLFTLDTVKRVYIIKNGKAIFPPDVKGQEWKNYMKMRSLKISTYSKVFPDGTKIILVYEFPAEKALILLLIQIIITGGVAAISVLILNRMYYRKWTDTLETEIERKTQEISAANEELSAMNEELLSMNEEIESMYRNLSELNMAMLEFLNFLREVDIKENIIKIFDNLYTILNKVLPAHLIGYEVIDEEGNIKLSRRFKNAPYSTDIRIGRYTFKMFSSEQFQMDSDEERFMEMLSLISELIIISHENYYTLEKSKNFLATLLSLVSVVSTSTSFDEVEETLLRKGAELFDDVVIVAIAWKKDEEEGVNIKFIRSKDNRIIEKKLTTGIIKYSMSVGKEYIVKDVSVDPVFYKEAEEAKSAVALPLITNEGVIGAFEIERSKKDAFTDDDLRSLRIFTDVVAITLQRLKYARELKETLIGLAEALSYAIDLKDPYTHGHSRRVANYSVEIAKEMGLPEEKIEEIELAAILHDIGKIGIKETILDKAWRLTEEESEEVKKHPVIGAKLVGKVGALKHVAKIIKHHHERCDGKGYPDGLTCEEIPIESRIIAVADAFDAMTSDRPYRKALSVQKALQILKNGKGKQWDENVVEAALKVFEGKFRIDA